MTADKHGAYDGEVTPAIAELSRIVLADRSLQDVLLDVADLAKRTIDEADEVSVTLLTGDRATTAAYTDRVALVLDELQYDDGYGPCLDAAKGSAAMLIDDMSVDPRWPRYTPQAVEAGVHSSLSVPLPVQQQLVAALNIYSRKPHAFADASQTLAETFASFAAVAITNAHLYTSATATAEQMQEAMRSRAVIEQAKGILMAVQRCDAETAFGELVRESQNTNRKVRDVAADLIRRAGGQVP
jgi:GAF domain-containing protein